MKRVTEFFRKAALVSAAAGLMSCMEAVVVSILTDTDSLQLLTPPAVCVTMLVLSATGLLVTEKLLQNRKKRIPEIKKHVDNFFFSRGQAIKELDSWMEESRLFHQLMEEETSLECIKKETEELKLRYQTNQSIVVYLEIDLEYEQETARIQDRYNERIEELKLRYQTNYE